MSDPDAIGPDGTRAPAFLPAARQRPLVRRRLHRLRRQAPIGVRPAIALMGSAEATVGQVERRRKTRRPEALGSPASWFQQSDELRGVWPQKREEQMAQEPENPKARAKGATRGLGRKDASRSEGEPVSGARGEGTLESWFSDDLKSWGGPEAWPENDASGVYTISITWRPLPGYETEAGAPAMEEKALSRSVSAKRARAILRMLEEDADDEPIGGGI